MEFLTVSVSSVPPSLQDHQSTLKNRLFIPKTTCLFSISLQKQLCLLPSKTRLLNSLQGQIPRCRNHASVVKADAFRGISRTHFMNSLQNPLSNHRTPSMRNMPSTHLSDPRKNCISDLETSCFLRVQTDHCSSPLQNHPSTVKTTSLVDISDGHLSTFIQDHLSVFKTASFFEVLITQMSDSIQNHFPIINHAVAFSLLSLPITFPSLAAETSIPTEQLSDKIDLEFILISIDNFFNRYPFFVASVTFVWLVVIPLIQEYLKKYKYTSTLDAFRKLRDNPNAVLLDIRRQRSLASIPSPNLKFLKKTATQVEYSEGEEDGFVKEVLKNFNDPGNTIICILDNFDGNSLKVAELLVTNGFKEAYAIKGGLRGKDGWQEIQEKFLPPSLHVYPRKKVKGSQKHYVQKEKTGSREENGKIPNSKFVNPDAKRQVENGSVKPAETTPQTNLSFKRPLSPYPNYPDFKPPASPSPSKPQK